MAIFRRKWPGTHWRPGLDLLNLGLLVVAAIVVKFLWTNETIRAWLPERLHAAVRWSVVALVALGLVLDVVGGFAELWEGVRRGASGRKGSKG